MLLLYKTFEINYMILCIPFAKIVIWKIDFKLVKDFKWFLHNIQYIIEYFFLFKLSQY